MNKMYTEMYVVGHDTEKKYNYSSKTMLKYEKM